MVGYIYGANNTLIHSSRPKGITCSDCGAKDQVEVQKIVRVVHLMYMPIVPISVIHLFICKSCGYEFELKERNKETDNYFKQFKSKKLVPIWSFSVPILILLLLGFSAYRKNANEVEMLKRLSDGNQMQIIEFKTAEGQFSTMKTLKITGNSVWVNYNDYEVEEYRNIEDIAGDNFYRSDTSIVSIEMLEKMIDEGRVKAVYSQ